MTRLRDAWAVLRGRAQVIPVRDTPDLYVAISTGGKVRGGRIAHPFTTTAVEEMLRAAARGATRG